MVKDMTAKERMIAALSFEEVDYVPLSIYFNKNMSKYGYTASDPEKAIEFHLNLGVDPVINLPAPGVSFNKEVKTKVWVENDASKPYSVLYKEFYTPEGPLKMGVKLNSEWPYGEDIPLPGDDFLASHNHEPLIKSPQDVKRFKYLWQFPEKEDLENVIKKIENNKRIAQKYNIITVMVTGLGLAEFMFLMGAENLVYFAADYPESLIELAQIESGVNIERIRFCKEIGGVDLMKRFGGYEQTNFFSPSIYEEIVKPVLKNEVDMAKQIGIPMYYRVVTGMKPLLNIYSDMGLDCMEGFEPCLSDCSNKDIYDALGKKMCLWTGISSPGHIGDDDENTVRQAVRDAVDTFGRKGFILGVTNSIRAHWPWKNTLAMIDEWKKIR